jgi:hypothetical protein
VERGKPFPALSVKVAMAGGPSVRVSPGELLRPVEPKVLESVAERLKRMATGDPWAKVVRRVLSGDEPVRGVVVEEALRAEGALVGEMSPKQHARVLEIARRHGWKKSEAHVEGTRCKAFVRVGA